MAEHDATDKAVRDREKPSCDALWSDIVTMTPAARIIIMIHAVESGHDLDYAAALVEALSDGIAKKEMDSRIAFVSLVDTRFPAGSGFADVYEDLVAMHVHMGCLPDNLTVSKIRELFDQVSGGQSNVLAKRILIGRIRSIVAGYRRDATDAG